MRNSNCALDEDSAGVTIVGSRTNLGVPALTNLLPQTSLNVATRSPELTQLQAGSGWFKRKKNSEPFPGILQWGASFWPTTWLLNGGNLWRCNQATNKQSQRVCQSVYGSSALWHCLLACRMNLRFNKMHVRQDRKFQAQRDLHLQCLCKMHRCVELWSVSSV